MSDKQLVQISRFLSFVLRHKPETIGLTLDKNGWGDVDLLIDGINRGGRPLTREILDKIVITDEKQRYVFSPDKKFIRASQGHSIDIDLGLGAVESPEYLYHGTAFSSVARIIQEGLKPQKRQYVHLSVDIETAIAIGSRHGQPVVMQILAQQMCESGQLFYLSENNIWLTAYVESKFLRIVKQKFLDQ